MSNEHVIDETLQSLRDFLPRVADACLIISNFLRSDNETDALKIIHQFTEATEWSIQAINSIKLLNYPLNIDTSRINEHLKEAKDGLEIYDLVILADMFEYEIHPEIETWINEIKVLSGD